VPATASRVLVIEQIANRVEIGDSRAIRALILASWHR
jgi:hypothetical protein